MAYWGCLKIFTSENESFRHEVQRIPIFDVWAFKEALFSHFLSNNEDSSVSYFKFRAALQLRTETTEAITMTNKDNISGRKRGRDGGGAYSLHFLEKDGTPYFSDGIQ